MSFVDLKTCSKCKEEKPTSEFQKDSHKKDGLSSSCSVCRRKTAADYRRRNPEKCKESQRWSQFKKLNYYRNRHKIKGYKVVSTSGDKSKISVRAKTRGLVSRGLLKKEACAYCGSEKSEIHHWDYSKPSDITWFCKTHHALAHSLNYQLTGRK